MNRRPLGKRRLGGLASLILLVAACVAVATALTGAGIGVERDMRTMRAGWRLHPASGELAIVEVDARSVAALDHWPWPRRYLTTALDRLGAAGARTIAFDIDFSSRSTPADDASFAAALVRRGGAVILPTFSQYARSGSERTLDTLPLPVFRKAAFIAGVNVSPDADGVVRSYPFQITTRGVTRPSIGAMLAESGNVGGGSDFPIDYAIDPDTIPRISFVDLLEGRVPAAAIAGKRILIGATAIEIGDRYPVPRRGVIPGVVIQALAAETLMQKRAPVALGAVPLATFAMIGLAAIMLFLRGRRRLVGIGTLAVLLFLAPLPLETAGREADMVPALAAALAALATAAAAMVLGELRNRRFADQESGLPNARALAKAATGDEQVDVIVARLDRLTEIAAAIGHDAATAALLEVAGRLARIADTVIYRVEEDALAWIVVGEEDAEAEGDRFRSLADATRVPVEAGRIALELRAAFGVAGGRGRDVKDLMAGAQMAARRVRARGGDWDRFVEGDGDAARWELSLLGSFSDAIANGEIWVAYQPKVAATSRRVVGAEALVRWRHPTRGMIPPDSFIPLVESEGRAAELTAFVLDTAARDLARWRRDGADVCVAVNVSATLLRDPSIVTMVADAVARAGIDPALLTLELTESAIISDAQAAVGTIDALRALGVKLSIDDYGTGQSTLTYLKRFPANELKIDKSFVQNIVRSPSDRLLVRSTVELAHAMGMSVVAEGVEDEECLQALGAIGCDTIQGWHTGKPMPADAFGDLIAAPRALAA
ncbi:MAG: putative bifunctional diguanylate cyclase/phosphodiesterase [Janthinobacterium lividum]